MSLVLQKKMNCELEAHPVFYNKGIAVRTIFYEWPIHIKIRRLKFTKYIKLVDRGSEM